MAIRDPDSRTVEALPTRPGPPTAEIQISADRLYLTVGLPGLRLPTSLLVVAADRVRLRCVVDGTPLTLEYRLPCTVQPDRYVARELHGVLDVVMERASTPSR